MPNALKSQFKSKMPEAAPNSPSSQHLNVSQMLEKVRSNATITSDWLFMLLTAALVAAIGLVENSAVLLVTSMLISPITGPIVAGTFGTAVQDRSLQIIGMKNTFIGLFLSIVLGFVFGLVFCVIDELYEVLDVWPTYEMILRCEYHSLWVGMAIALPSGAALSMSLLKGTTGSLIAAAVSISLVPPAVNAGILWAMAVIGCISSMVDGSWLITRPRELVVLGSASLCLTFVNIVCIHFAGIAAFKIKGVHSLDRTDLSLKKAEKDLYQQPIKHDYNNYNNFI